MKPKDKSKTVLGITQSKAKMHEYSIPEEYQDINMYIDPAKLLSLTIGIIGDVASSIAKESESDDLTQQRETLLFAAQYFDSYLESRLNSELDQYLLLVGAAAYYLCDLPGSSIVLTNRLNAKGLDLNCNGLEQLLLWILRNNTDTYFKESNNLYGKLISHIFLTFIDFSKNGTSSAELNEECQELRQLAYNFGTPRELLFADIISAVFKKRVANSVWTSLPQYTGLSDEAWADVFKKDGFIKELWPAQILLGEQGVFNGNSAVVQMPTSAGKTKSTEIIIRSNFISGRSRLVIIIAPFRALCSEISNSMLLAFKDEDVTINSPSDVLQNDFSDVGKLVESSSNTILILTPEKFMYMLRNNPEIGASIGLLIYDEGHQFDSGARGVTYELLLSSLKQMVPEDIQTVLISAVISNADSIGKWLNGDDGEIVQGSTLLPTYRTIAFASWKDTLGQLKFVNQLNLDSENFFVPRVIEEHPLELKGGERKEKFFPEKNNGQDIALYLGLKTVKNGSVAIFCGTKSTVNKLCGRVVDVYSRSFTQLSPSFFSNIEEVERLVYLHKCHFGEDSHLVKSARRGVFSHSGSTPQGLRLAIEHAMQTGDIKFVICTSTLAQGVNLPIKYLIVSSIYQGRERIRTRDFHNLIGRAGRAGMHTEGSILFVDPNVYDKRFVYRERWRWQQAKELLNPINSEPCASSILSIFEKLTLYGERLDIDPIYMINLCINGADSPWNTSANLSYILGRHSWPDFENILERLTSEMNILAAIESYIMAHLDESCKEISSEQIKSLATGTLAYHLANENQKELIIKTFILLAKHINHKMIEPEKRRAFGKTLYGVNDLIKFEWWINNNIESIKNLDSEEELLEKIWQLLWECINNRKFLSITPRESLLDLAKSWICGIPFYSIWDVLMTTNAYLQAGSQRRRITHETVIEICESGLAYDGTLIIGALAEIIKLNYSNEKEIVDRLNLLQKQLKYGLPSARAIAIYECGFSDRVIAIELASVISPRFDSVKFVRKALVAERINVMTILSKYPSYYKTVYGNL